MTNRMPTDTSRLPVPRPLSVDAVRQLSAPVRLSVAGLVLTAAGMAVQIVAGSTLYPSLAGPIALLTTAVAVAFVRRRWAAWAGLVVPIVLGLGAIVAAAMTGDFIDQLTGVGKTAVFIGSLMHVVGLVAAVAGGVGMLIRPGAAGDGRR